MPQASGDQRALMNVWFGDPIDEGPPIQFLRSRGYTCTDDWFWQKPTPSHTISEHEWACIDFLCAEWDYGFKG